MNTESEALKTRLSEHLAKIGYPAEGVDYIVNHIMPVMALYDQPDQALALVVERMEKVSGLFSSKQFLLWLKRINPEIIPQHELFGFGVTPAQAREFMEGSELTDYLAEYRRFRTEAIAQRKASLSPLREEYYWQILTSKNWREIQPSTGHVNEIRPSRLIYTPTGGQPPRRKK